MESMVLNISEEDTLQGLLKFKVLLFFSESEKIQPQTLLLLTLHLLPLPELRDSLCHRSV